MAAEVTAQLVACEPPRAPQAVLASGEPARALARRLLELDDAALAALSCGASEGVLVVRGAASQLPWVDGARYLAALPGAPELLVPTHQAPSVPPELVARAVQRLCSGPAAWLRDEGDRDVLVSLSELRAPSRKRLLEFARDERS
jgi:hypothetical protein